LEEAGEKAESPRTKTWCEENLGVGCLLDEYANYRERCLVQQERPCEFGEILETIEKLPLDIRLDMLRKMSELQIKRLEEEFEG
jgi:hypothetical protein